MGAAETSSLEVPEGQSEPAPTAPSNSKGARNELTNFI